MLGGIVGDYVGSVWEYKKWNGTDELINGKNFITDDSLVLLATMKTLIKYHDDYRFHHVSSFDFVKQDYKRYLLDMFKENLNISWGNYFIDWVQGYDKNKPKSIGNGFMARYMLLENFSHNGSYCFNKLINIQYDSKVVNDFMLRLREELLSQDTNKNELKWFHEHRRFDDSYFGCVNRLMCVFNNINLNYEKDIAKAIYVNGDSDTFACIVGTFVELFMNTVKERAICPFQFSNTIAKCHSNDKYNGTKEVIEYMNKHDITLNKLFNNNQEYVQIVKYFYMLYFPEAYEMLDMESL